MILLIITVIIVNVVVYFIPKRLSLIEIYTTSLFAVLLNVLTDTFLDLKYNFYGYFQKGVDFENLIAIFGIYPAFNIIFLTFYPFKKLLKYRILYIAAWSVLSLLYEWTALQTKFLYHHEWNLSYSALVYPILYLILVGNFKFTRKLIQKQYISKD